MAGSKTIFVANIPFDTSEEQLARVFSEAGPVQGVDIKFGPDGKPRGFGFIQFYDEAAAASAVRNLNGVEVNDRSLRIEASSDTPNHRQAGRGGGPGGGQGAGGGGRGPPPRGGRDRSSPPPPFRPPPPGAGYGMPPPGAGYGGPPPPMGGGMGMGMGGPPGPPGRVDLGMLPPGIELPRGENALDGITKTLAGISPGQLQDVMAGMKVLISTQPDQARQLLTTKPQLAYALFQAMIQLNIVDPQVVQQIQALPAPGQNQNQYQPPQSNYPPPQPPSSYPPPSNYNQPPPQPQAQAPYPPASNDPRLNSYRPPPPTQGSGYGAPPPQNYPPSAAPPAAASGISPEVQATLNTLPADQRETLMAVLQMSPDQINALDPTQRASVMQLRQQFLGV